MRAERGSRLASGVKPSASAAALSREALDGLSRSRGTSLTVGEGGFEGDGGGLRLWGGGDEGMSTALGVASSSG